jgi:O-antigen ligase
MDGDFLEAKWLAVLRQISVGALAVSVSLPMGFVSASKALLVLVGIAVFWGCTPRPLGWRVKRPPVNTWIYLGFLAIPASGLWTQAPEALMWKSINHHGTLLLIPLLYFMVKTKNEAHWALRGYALGQLFVLASSWALFAGVSIPWQTALDGNTGNQFATFSSYLDQSIMASVFAAILWHVRAILVPGWQRYGVAPACLAALGCVFFLLPGRTGQLVGLAMISLWVMWLLPSRLRLAALCAPVIFMAALLVFSKPVYDRFDASWAEARAYAQGDARPTSIGFRLEAWRSALVSIREHPLAGTGAGSWGQQYDAVQSAAGRPNENPTDGNPHQEFLLWGVELGLGGIVLLLGILGSIFQLSLRMEVAARRATQSALLATVIACLFNCALYDALIGDYLCVTLALCLAAGLKPDTKDSVQNEHIAGTPART